MSTCMEREDTSDLLGHAAAVRPRFDRLVAESLVKSDCALVVREHAQKDLARTSRSRFGFQSC